MPSLMAILGLDAQPFERGLRGSESKAAQAGDKIGGALAGRIKTALATAGFAVTVGEAISKMNELGEKAAQIHAGSLRLGVDENRFQNLQRGAEKSQSSIEALYTAYKKLTVGQYEALNGNKEMVKYFETLGLSVDSLRQLTPDELFQRIADRMQKASVSGSELTAVIKTMGRSADELLPGLIGGKFSQANPFAIPIDQLNRLREYRKEMGLIKGIVGATSREFLTDTAEQFFGTNKNSFANFITGGGYSALEKYVTKDFRTDDGSAGEQNRARWMMEAAAAAETEASAEGDKNKELREEERLREKLQSLIMQTMAETKRYNLEKMTDPEKLKYFQEQNAALGKEKFDDTPEGLVKNAERNLQIAQNLIQIQSLQNAIGKGSTRDAMKDFFGGHVNELQRIGAYAAPNPLQLESLSLMRTITKGVGKVVDNTTHGNRRTGGVKF